ncbi:MAG: nucleoside hydrolase [Candidatus Dormibacteraceae bacterium]
MRDRGRSSWDCDPGHDDALALLLAQGSPAIEVVAVTTVAGNQTIEKVTRNARVVATLAGITAPIAAGARRPLVRDQQVGADIHGASGMDGPELPPPRVPLDSRHGVRLLIDTVMAAAPGEITLVPTGPLTNIALAARLEPQIVDRVREVVLMGGGVNTGNWSPVAEFNIAVDPEAAHIVFNEPWSVTMVGLNVTHQALATPQVLERIRALGTGPARFVLGLLEFFGTTYRELEGFSSPPVHDPCAVAHVIDPTVVVARPTPLDIELDGRLTAGMTVADLRSPAPRDCTTKAATELDHERFWGLLIDALITIGEGGR